MQVYLVGGAVRDYLLGHPYQEKTMLWSVQRRNTCSPGFQPVGKDFLCFFIPKPKKNTHLHEPNESLDRISRVSILY